MTLNLQEHSNRTTMISNPHPLIVDIYDFDLFISFYYLFDSLVLSY
jgi:hypothetical protein